MANVKHFADIAGQTIALTNIRTMDRKEFALAFPGVTGKRCDSFSLYVGNSAEVTPVWDTVARRYGPLYPVTRMITYKSQPSRHECDARCMNATGRTMNCECACNGKNHGRGSSLNCVSVAA